MDQNIFIRQDRAEHYEFQLQVNGLPTDEIAVRFVLHSDPFMITIPCTRVKGDTWSVELPKMPFLEATTYQFVIEAVVEGHYFEAFRGSVTVAKSPEVYVRNSDAQVKLRNRDFTAAPSAKPATEPEETKVTAAAEEKSDTQSDTSTIPEPSSDRFKEILDKIKNSAKNAEKEEASDATEEETIDVEKQAVEDAEEKQEEEIEQEETETVKDAEEQVDKAAEKEKSNDKKDKKKESKKEKKTDTNKGKTKSDEKAKKVKEILDNLDKTTLVAEQPAVADPFANARKAADELLSKPESTPATDIQLEDTNTAPAKKTADRDKVKELINETRREREERKQREELRRQRLAEQHQQKQREEEEARQAAEQKKKDEESALLEARKQQESERDKKARQVLESIKKQPHDDKPRVKFQKGETIVK
jgi:hypothetical protein